MKLKEGVNVILVQCKICGSIATVEFKQNPEGWYISTHVHVCRKPS